MPCIGQDGAVTGHPAAKHFFQHLRQQFQPGSLLDGDRQNGHKGQLSRLHRFSQVGFVDEGNGIGGIQAQRDDVPILLGQRLRAVTEENCQIRFLQRLFGALHAHGFHGVGGLPDTGGVNQPQPGGADHDGFLHRVPGGAGDVGDNGTVKACQAIEQAGFSHIGATHNGGGNALAENPPLPVGLQQGIQLLGGGTEGGGIILQPEILNVLVRVIQHGMEVAAQVHQLIVNGCQLLLQHAAYLTGGIGGSIGGIGFNQVDDGFCLGQVHFPVQKCPLGKFAPSGGSCTGVVQRFQSRCQHRR